MRLTEHFTLEELTVSRTASKLGIDNKPDVGHVYNLTRLCQTILEPIRELYCYPIIVTSGFRCEKLNKAVGGSKTSQHLTGEAVDIKCTKTTKAYLFHLIKSLIQYEKIVVGQLIWEYGTDKEPDWIHISLPRENKKNNQVIYLYNK